MLSITNTLAKVQYGKIVLDAENLRIINASEGFFALFGFCCDDIEKGLYYDDLFSDCGCEKIRWELISEIKNKGESCFSIYMYTKDRTKLYILCHGSLEKNKNGKDAISLTLSDISEDKHRYSDLLVQSKCYRIIEEHTDEIYFEYDVNNDILHIPKKYQEQIKGRYDFNDYWAKCSPEKSVHPEDFEAYKQAWSECIDNKENRTIEFRTRAFSDDGRYEWYRLPLMCITDDQGLVVTVFGRLISIQREKMLYRTVEMDQQIIEKLTSTDHLTGLYNRAAFKRKAAQLLSNYDENKCYSLAYSDINDFSYINDNFGYQEGNKALCEFANLIAGKPGETVISCRIYSDYFITFSITDSKDDMINILSEKNEEFSKSLKAKYPASDIHVSTGIYFFDKDNRDVTIAIDNANLARRSVKGSKDVPCGIYCEELRKRRRHDQKIASELPSAIANGEIEMFLQPKFSLRSREIIGAEALARWRNPDGTYKLPFEFVDVLEKVGYIMELDFFIYESLLKCMKRWKEQKKKLVPISVNFSRLHNSRNDFVSKLIELADRYGVDKRLIEIEVTESVFASDYNTMIRNMTRLREAGFRIDIDDFGIGYSSLSMLMNAPIDTVKVDKVFIDNLDASKSNREYVKQMCILIATTHKEVVFEGVETEEQAEFLSQWGFNIAQGWLFDRAISIKDFETKYLEDLK